MLKIRDDVNLKELKKFGFKGSRALFSYYEKEVKNTGTYWISKKTRTIEFSVILDEDVLLDDTLYDLIKADLVVKE